MPDLFPVSFLFILQQGGFQTVGEMSYKKVFLGEKRAHREKAMLDLKNALAQKSKSKLSWNLANNEAQPHKKLTHLSLVSIIKCVEPGSHAPEPGSTKP